MFLNLTNTNQFIVNANDIATSTAAAFGADLDDTTRALFENNLKARLLEGYLDMDMITAVKDKTRLQAAKLVPDQDNGSSDAEY